MRDPTTSPGALQLPVKLIPALFETAALDAERTLLLPAWLAKQHNGEDFVWARARRVDRLPRVGEAA
jgi:hypothetical protein